MMTGYPVLTSRSNPLNPQPGGKFTMNYPAGADTVASLQPDGTFATRVKGTAGRWELCTPVQGGLLFESDGFVTQVVPWYQL